MSDDKLFRQKILQEVATQRALHKKALPVSPRAKLLGAFIKACLENNQQSEADFAQQLKISPEMATSILQGTIPDWLLSDEAIIRMAAVLRYDANILRIMIARHLNIDPDNLDFDDEQLESPAHH